MKVPLANVAQPDALNNEGKGVLHYACIKGDLNATKLLINTGADVDVKVRRFKGLIRYDAVNRYVFMCTSKSKATAQNKGPERIH